MHFLVQLKDLKIVVEKQRHDFLNEMNCSEILQRYRELYYLENISNSNIKELKIEKKQKEIDQLFKRLDMPKYIIMRNKCNKLIELYTNEELNLDEEVPIELLDDESLEGYCSSLTDNNVKYLKKSLPLFKSKSKS